MHAIHEDDSRLSPLVSGRTDIVWKTCTSAFSGNVGNVDMTTCPFVHVDPVHVLVYSFSMYDVLLCGLWMHFVHFFISLFSPFCCGQNGAIYIIRLLFLICLSICPSAYIRLSLDSLHGRWADVSNPSLHVIITIEEHQRSDVKNPTSNTFIH